MQCLHQLVSKAASRYPEQPAVVDDQRVVTYRELDQQSDQLAALLQREGIGPDDTVGLYLQKSVDYVVACLACLKAGGAFLPLFLDSPPSQLRQVVEETQTKAVLTTSFLKADLPSTQNEPTVLEMDTVEFQDAPQLQDPGVTPENLMFVVYTSGTTGQPKGIALPHRAAVHSYAERYKLSDYRPGQRVACNIFFVWEIFRPLTRGAAVHVVSDDIIYDPKRLTKFLSQRKVTEVLFTPSLMETMLLHVDPETWHKELSTLEVVWLNGEVVTEQLRAKALESLSPKVKLLNTYSISECHDVASLDLRTAEVSPSGFCRVGYPIDGITVHLMDENGTPVQENQAGELYVGGPGLARGYLGKPHLTAERFVNYRGERLYRTGDIAFQYPNSLLEIRGRCDSMVKIRGYSVHLGAVQSVLEKLPTVKSAAVIAVGKEGRDKRLVAYVVGTPEKTWTIDSASASCPQLREAMRSSLPEFMLPNLFVEMMSVPLSPTTGKLDTKLLPPLPCRRLFSVDDLALSRGANLEEKLVLVRTLWERLLGLDPGVVGNSSNFFDLGGHSLMAVRVVQHLEKLFSKELSVKNLYSYPTVKQLVNYLETGTAESTSEGPRPADWQLPPDLHYKTSEPVLLKEAKGIFLTGGTGFLGAFLLDCLSSRVNCPIYCLVRPGEQGAERRLNTAIQNYGLSKRPNVRALAGDLSQPQLGLSVDDYNLLTDTCDLVFHCGAAVNYVHDYNVLKPHTVDGTTSVLELCAFGPPKTLHYISTNGVFAGGGTYLENDQIESYLDHLENGYGHSKWVAEKLVWEAASRGLRVTIYRPGNIGHHSRTGAANTSDFQYLLIQAAGALKAAPEVKDWYFEMTPVDFLTESITELANHRWDGSRVFNVVQSPTIEAGKLFDKLKAEGVIEGLIPVEEWTEKLLQHAVASHHSKFEVLANSLPDVEGYLQDTSRYDRSEFNRALTEVGRELPDVSVDYLTLVLHPHSRESV